MTITTGYFVDTSPTTNGFWLNTDKIFNTNETDFGENDSSGSTSSNFCHGKTTNISEIIGENITQVRVRLKAGSMLTNISASEIFTHDLNENLGTVTATFHYTSPAYGSWIILSEPSGGWTWDKSNNLEAKNYTLDIFGSKFCSLEIEVTSEAGGPVTKISTNDGNARLMLQTTDINDGNARLMLQSISTGFGNARLYVAGANETTVDITLTVSTNQDIELETTTNQEIILTTSTNQEIILT